MRQVVMMAGGFLVGMGCTMERPVRKWFRLVLGVVGESLIIVGSQMDH